MVLRTAAYDLNNVLGVRIEECEFHWTVRGEDHEGYAVVTEEIRNKDHEETAHDLARAWCRQLGLSSYVVEHTSNDPLHIVERVDVETCEIIATRTVDIRLRCECGVLHEELIAFFGSQQAVDDPECGLRTWHQWRETGQCLNEPCPIRNFSNLELFARRRRIGWTQ